MSEYILIMVVCFVAAVIFGVIGAIGRTLGNEVPNKFAAAGKLTGKSLSEITSLVGPPNRVSGLPGGKVLYEWVTTHYHIALRFDGEVCEGVVSESRI